MKNLCLGNTDAVGDADEFNVAVEVGADEGEHNDVVFFAMAGVDRSGFAVGSMRSCRGAILAMVEHWPA